MENYPLCACFLLSPELPGTFARAETTAQVPKVPIAREKREAIHASDSISTRLPLWAVPLCVQSVPPNVPPGTLFRAQLVSPLQQLGSRRETQPSFRMHDCCAKVAAGRLPHSACASKTKPEGYTTDRLWGRPSFPLPLSLEPSRYHASNACTAAGSFLSLTARC